jgi:hypothetical protein
MRKGKTFRQSDHSASRLACLSGDGFFDRRVVVNWSKRHRHPQRLGSGFDRAVEQPGEGRSVRVEDDGDPPYARSNLLEQAHPFSHRRRVVNAEPRDVAAGPGFATALAKLKESSIETITGNAARSDVLKAANPSSARYLILAIPEAFESGQIVDPMLQ